MPRRFVLLGALAALLLAGAPAVAAPPEITDGFVTSGIAGTQTRVRLTRPMPVLDAAGRPRIVSVRASSGPVAGVALMGVTNRSISATVLGATARWTCGAADCGADAVLDDQCRADCPRWSLPKGEYVLVVIGAPGARIDVSQPPLDRRSRSARIRLTHRVTPILEEIPLVATRSGTDPVARGQWQAPLDTRPGLFFLVHVISMELAHRIESRLEHGQPDLDGCYGLTYGGSYHEEDYPPPLKEGPAYRVHSSATWTQPGEQTCGYVEGRVVAARSTQRAVALFLPAPLVLPG